MNDIKYPSISMQNITQVLCYWRCMTLMHSKKIHCCQVSECSYDTYHNTYCISMICDTYHMKNAQRCHALVDMHGRIYTAYCHIIIFHSCIVILHCSCPFYYLFRSIFVHTKHGTWQIKRCHTKNARYAEDAEINMT